MGQQIKNIPLQFRIISSDLDNEQRNYTGCADITLLFDGVLDEEELHNNMKSNNILGWTEHDSLFMHYYSQKYNCRGSW